jgi:hypothetical protein
MIRKSMARSNREVAVEEEHEEGNLDILLCIRCVFEGADGFCIHVKEGFACIIR